MNIRAAAPGDHSAIRDVLLAAFPGPDEADLVEQLRADGDAAIELVAEQDGRIVGHILFSPVHGPFRALALAPVAVAPQRHGEGIGSALIKAGHELARGQAWDAIFVLGEPAYYRRFDYDPALAAGFDSPYAGPYFMALALRGALPATEGQVTHARAFAGLG
ncbi:N-acetyltransferase [Sphingomonas sp.]|uniref:GNAT family N-acetyltransferase n=1 Tax=Sphingomonas sp. TaxID=28214 RepID=UPI001847BC7C|nr:N-acetyltransferase [Sphingomonas sp.]MBA3511894.1 N-acetyltransferase [Sphingomonas sp.]